MKKVILVDHNSYEQSVIGLNEAEILEIIDHHNIGSIGTIFLINLVYRILVDRCIIHYLVQWAFEVELLIGNTELEFVADMYPIVDNLI